MATYKQWGIVRKAYKPLSQKKTFLTRHAKKTIMRVGNGIDPNELVRRVIKRNELPPDGLSLKKEAGKVYRKYGDHAFIFTQLTPGKTRTLITVVGPFVRGMLYDTKRHRLVRP